MRNNKESGKEDRGEKPETEKKIEERLSHAANTHYLTPGLSATYYSATGASRTTMWSLKADDEEKSDGRIDPQRTNHVYLISYIWYATKENKIG